MRAFLRSLGESWPALAGIGGILIFVGVLSTRVQFQADQIKEEKALREKLTDNVATEQKEILRVVTQTAQDVAVLRARLEPKLAER